MLQLLTEQNLHCFSAVLAEVLQQHISFCPGHFLSVCPEVTYWWLASKHIYLYSKQKENNTIIPKTHNSLYICNFYKFKKTTIPVMCFASIHCEPINVTLVTLPINALLFSSMARLRRARAEWQTISSRSWPSKSTNEGRPFSLLIKALASSANCNHEKAHNKNLTQKSAKKRVQV